MTSQYNIRYSPDDATSKLAHVPVIIIGGGQAGLATGRLLSESRIEFLILEAGRRIGDSWRKRWDSLRLFSPAKHSALPGHPFPGNQSEFPTKDQVADYLEAYALGSRLPVCLNTKVKALERVNETYIVKTNRGCFEADNVVVATGPYQTPRIPSWASDLNPDIVQIHAGAYKNPRQLPPGDVLVIGAGNTGAELAIEAASAGHRVYLSGRDVGHVPRVARIANGVLFWFLTRTLFTLRTPIGRRIHKALRAGHGGPLVRVRPKDIAVEGIRRVGRVSGTRDRRPVLENGEVLNVESILWCTGFGLDFSWVHLPILAPDGYPLHDRGRALSEPGLFFVGLPFQRSLSSSLLGGVGRDAAMVTKWIVEGMKRSTKATESQRSSFRPKRLSSAA